MGRPTAGESRYDEPGDLVPILVALDQLMNRFLSANVNESDLP